MKGALKGFPVKRLAQALILVALVSACMFTGCAENDSSNSSDKEAQGVSSASSQAKRAQMDFDYADEDLDASYGEEDAVIIDLMGEEVSAQDERVRIEGTNITIAEAGVYVLSGMLSDGQVLIDAPEDAHVRLVFRNASLHNEDGPAVYVKSAKKCLVTLDKGTENTLTDGSDYALEEGKKNPCATLFAECDLSFNGEGTLNVTSGYRHAVYTMQDLVMTGGAYAISSEEDALHGRACVKVRDGSFDVQAGGHALASSKKANQSGFVSIDGGTFKLAAKGSAVRAVSYLRVMDGSVWAESMGDALQCDAKILIAGGNMVLSSGDDAVQAGSTLTVNGGTVEAPSCFEGFEARKIIVKDGTVDIVSTDDAISASSRAAASENEARERKEVLRAESAKKDSGKNGESGEKGESESEKQSEGEIESVVVPHKVETGMVEGGTGMGRKGCLVRIEGGYVTLDAGGDGIDSNGSVEISGGVVLIGASETGDNAPIDYDLSAEVSGGTVLASGKKNMAQNFTGGSQPFAFVEVSGAAGESLALVGSDGEVIASYTPLKGYDFVLVSCPQFEEGKKYELVLGGKVKNGDAHGYAAEGTVSGGKSAFLKASKNAVGGMGGLSANGLGKPAGEQGDEQPVKKSS